MLASQSPRRRQLLARAGVAFEVSPVLVDDTHLDCGKVGPRAWATALAYLKAAGAALALRKAGRLAPGAIVLGSDTVVAHRGGLIGKPVDADDARRIVRTLADDSHDVFTGVALVDTRADTWAGAWAGAAPGRRLFCDGARVEVGAIADSALDDYIASGRWAGKAGAYNLEEQVAAGWPITWEGDPTTVMGLPMARLLPELRRLGLAGAEGPSGPGVPGVRGGPHIAPEQAEVVAP